MSNSKDQANNEGDQEKDLSSEEIQEVGETIEKLSEKEPKLVSEFMALSKMGSIPNPLHDKLTDEHIDKIVDLAVKHDERQFELHKEGQSNEFDDKQSDKRYYLTYFIISAVVFLIILFTLKDNPEILVPTLTGLGG